MSHGRGGLGRGLDALFPQSAAGSNEIDVDRIVPNPGQPRQHFDSAALNELATSIRQHGVLQPVIVSRQGPDFVLIAGERRWRAAQLAGLATVPAVIRDASPASTLQMALVENVQRADLTAIGEAAAYRSLIEEHGLTQAEVADRVGRSRSAVANRLRLLTLPPRARTLLAEGALTEGHARALLGCEDTGLLDVLADRVASTQLNVRQTEELVRRHASRRHLSRRQPSMKPAPPRDSRGRPSDEATDIPATLTAIEDQLRQTLGTKVQLVRSRQGGRVIIHYYDDDQLSGLVEAILGGKEL